VFIRKNKASSNGEMCSVPDTDGCVPDDAPTQNSEGFKCGWYDYPPYCGISYFDDDDFDRCDPTLMMTTLTAVILL